MLSMPRLFWESAGGRDRLDFLSGSLLWTIIPHPDIKLSSNKEISSEKEISSCVRRKKRETFFLASNRRCQCGRFPWIKSPKVRQHCAPAWADGKPSDVCI